MENYVNISPDLIDEQLREIKNENGVRKQNFVFDEKNYLNTKLAPGEREKTITVRILPVSATDGHAFFAINLHQMKVSQDISKSGFKTFICINDPNVTEGREDAEKCPLCAKARELFNLADNTGDEYEKRDLINAAKNFMAKKAFIVRVIDRDHEDEGVKFWRFNHHKNGDGVYDQLTNLYRIRMKESENAGQGPFNIFDLKNGKDIVITLRYDPATKKTSTSITDAGFATPLSKDEAKISEWVNDKKTWKDIYSSKSAAYLQVIADGGIPFFDKTEQKWVAKAENVAQQGEVVEQKAETPLDIPAYNGPEDNDLPF